MNAIRRSVPLLFLWCALPALAVDDGRVLRDSLPPEVPDLITLYTQALRDSPSIVGALAASEAARQGEAAAKGQLLPQVGVFGEAAYVDERIRGDFFGLADIDREQDFERFIYGLGIEQAVLRPSLWADLDRSRLIKLRTDLAEREARSRLASQLMERYLGVLEAVEVKTAAEARVDAVTNQQKQVDSRVEAGLLTRADQSQAEASASLARVQASMAESEVAASVARLRSTANWTSRSLQGLTEDFTFILPQPLDEAFWVERAAANSLLVLNQEIELALAQLELRRAQRGRWPTVDLFGSATQLDTGGGVEGERDQRDMRIGARARMPLFSGGSISAAIAAQEAAVILAQAELDRLRTDARLAAATAYRQVVVGRSQLTALQQAVDASRIAEVEFRIGFEAGRRTNADMLSATERRFFAEVELQRRRYRQLVEALTLKQVAGTVGPEDIKQLNRLLVRPVVIPF